MQIPILNGMYTSESGDFRSSYPVNLIPVPVSNGISQGYLRPAEGITLHGTGPGADRAGINWNGVCYRVMGSKLVRIDADGTTTTLGNVGGSELATLDYSFDALGIASGGDLYYWNGITLTQVTDTDIGNVVDTIWVDGYWMTTDGTYLVVTDLNDPLSVNPFKYGSAEADPDSIKALLKLRNEPVALNRHTIEFFDNVGGDLFPFQRIEGAQIMKGTVGTHTACVFVDAIAFLGSGRNESLSVYLGTNGGSAKIATREIDQIIAGYTEAQLSTCLVESRSDKGHAWLYVHLPDRTLVYDAAASSALSQPVWFVLDSGSVEFARYRAWNFVYCYDRWLSGDPTTANHGVMSSAVSSHYGAEVGWEFATSILYNEGRGAIFHELELVTLTGRVTGDPLVWSSYSNDGETWSMELSKSAGTIGERTKRISWLQQGYMSNWRIQKFRGTSDAHVSIARLQARLEPLNV